MVKYIWNQGCDGKIRENLQEVGKIAIPSDIWYAHLLPGLQSSTELPTSDLLHDLGNADFFSSEAVNSTAEAFGNVVRHKPK